MKSLWRVFSIAAVASAVLTNFAKADDQLMEGVKSFMCDSTPIVLLGSDSDWVFTDEPGIEVHRTNNGWRLGDQGLGFIGFLQKRATDDWVLESLSEDGFVEKQCIDVTEVTSKVVSAIRPRLSENIVAIQEQLAVVNQQLATARADYEALRADYEALQADYETLQKEKRELEEVDIVSREIDRLRVALDAAERLNAIYEGKIQTLKGELDAAISRVAQEESRRRAIERKLTP